MGGNFQSDSEIRTQRLSKPRTSTSTSNLLNLTAQNNEPSSPLTPTDTYGLGGNATVVTSPTGEVRSRRDARSKLRDYLYGPNNQIQAPSSEEEDDGPKRFSKVAGGLKKRLSRSGSSFTQLSSAKSSSLYLTNSSGSRLVLSSELSTDDLEESQLIARGIKEKAFADSIAAHNHVSSPVDEDKHPDSVMAPIRRRSLFTPGIATRDPNDILRKPPLPNRSQSQVDLAYYYNPLLPETSPLSQLAALDITGGGRSTPSDLTYSHLGGLKLGTLRVTNGGAASPAPDVHTPVEVMSNITQMDDHYTTSEGGRNKGDIPHDHRFSHTASELLPRSVDLQIAVNEYSVKAKSREGYTETSEISAQEGANLTHERTHEFINTEDTIYHSHLKSLSTRGSMGSTQHSSRSPNRASVMAEDYMADLPGSPFWDSATFDRGILDPGFKPAMHTIEDGAFGSGADATNPQSSSAEMWRLFINDAEVRHANTETREDAFRRLTANAASVSDTASRSLSPSPHSRNRDSISTLLDSADGNFSTKGDSGYYSNESLKTLSGAVVSNNLEDSSSRPNPISSQQLSRSLSGPRGIPQPTPSSEKLAIPQQPGRPAPVRPSAMVTSKSTSAVPPASQVTQTSTTTTVTVSYLHNPVKLDRPVTQTSPIPKRNSIQQSRPDPGMTKANKLRKPRPLSHPLPVDLITLQRNLSLRQADIPSVPSHVSMKHADRLREFPLLEHTFPSLQHTQASDTLSIEEPMYVPIRFPSPANAMEEEKPSKDISITTRLSQYSTREPIASPLNDKRASTLSEDEDFTTSDIVRSPSWSDFGRRGREKRRLEKEKASKKMQGAEDNVELDEEGLPVSEICRSPSWATFGAKKKQKRRSQSEKRASEKSPKKDEPKKRNILTRNRSSTITKSEPQSSRTSVEATIADFGTVTESLGGSPYDIAKGAVMGHPRTAQNTNISHPHQMTTAMPRAKSSMDEEYAAEFARLRSRQRSYSASRSEVPTRRSFDERMAVSEQTVRPQSMYVDIPPVPALPRNFEQNEAFSYDERPMYTVPESSFPQTPTVSDISPIEEPEQFEMTNRHDRFSGTRARPQSMFADVQPTPAFAAVDLPMHRQIVSSRDDSAKIVRPRSMIIEAPSRPAHVLAEKHESREIFNDPRRSLSRNIRPRSMFLDVPPVPALPTDEEVEQKEAQVSRSSSELSMTLVGPRKVKKISESPSKKDLWESAALTEENSPAPRLNNGWEAHQQAWADRRKLAGDALLSRNQTAESVDVSTQPKPANIPAEATNYLSPASALSARSRTPSPAKPAPRPFHRPLYPPQDTTTVPAAPTHPPPPPPSTTSTAPTPSTASFNDRLVGRYDGGLAYGYEPGVGIGGSAGTRSAKTGASRKSIGFSQGYGVDLSDVPIFVSPNN